MIVALILCTGLCDIVIAEEQPGMLTNSRGERYHPGTPTYVPLIDNCIIAGGIRGECKFTSPGRAKEA